MPSSDSSSIAFASAVLLLAIQVAQTMAQPADRAASLPPAEVEELDATSAAHLAQAKRFLAEQQWSEAVEAIRRVQEVGADRLIRVDLNYPGAGFERYVPASEYCQWRLAALAAEAPRALEHYRSLVDPLAERWLREGQQNNAAALLERVVDQALASSHGDEALLKLGDLALARGEPATARAAWQRIGPAFTVPLSAASALRAQPGSPLWLALRKFDFAAQSEELRELLSAASLAAPGVYPDSDLDPAAVQARLVLASIMENSRERAAVELSIVQALYPTSEGELGGTAGRHVDRLQEVLDESAQWPAIGQSPGWGTFGGDSTRGKIAQREIDPAGRMLWSYPLPRLSAEREWLGAERLRPAEDAQSLLGYHPLVVGQTVLVNMDARGNSYVVALDLKTGRRLWQVDFNRGVSSEASSPADADSPPAVGDAHADLARHVGAARHTLSAIGSKLVARVGSPVTAASTRRSATWLSKDQGFLLGLDVASEGKPLTGFPIRPPSSEWTFEGTPLHGEGNVYVAMRRVGGAQSQLYLAAFDLPTTSVGSAADQDENSRPIGRLKWRTRVCSSQTPGGSELDHLSHLLVTRSGGQIYLNTNAGAVAAVRATDGKLQWLVKYPRSPARTTESERAARHWFRDLTPCLAWKDFVIVAPADCEHIFALEAATGQLAWALPPGVADDAVHLLGVQNDVLFASGDALYWIDAQTGRLLTQFPRGQSRGREHAVPEPQGYGRGVIASNHVWWPTRESIFVLDATPATANFGQQPRLIREIPLVPRGVTGGNLVLSGGVLLVAIGDRLVAFGE